MSTDNKEGNKPEQAKTDLAAQAASIKDQPTDADLEAKRQGRKPAKPKRVPVQTVSGGDMRDPETGTLIEGTPTLAEESRWLTRQIQAKKIKAAE